MAGNIISLKPGETFTAQVDGPQKVKLQQEPQPFVCSALCLVPGTKSGQPMQCTAPAHDPDGAPYAEFLLPAGATATAREHINRREASGKVRPEQPADKPFVYVTACGYVLTRPDPLSNSGSAADPGLLAPAGH